MMMKLAMIVCMFALHGAAYGQAGEVRLPDREFHGDELIPLGTGYARVMCQDGEWLTVHSPHESASALGSGAIYVYRKSSSGYEFFQKLEVANCPRSLGSRPIHQRGNVIILGSRQFPGGSLVSGWQPGAVFIFEFNGTQWVETTRLDPDPLHTIQGWSAFPGPICVVNDETIMVAEMGNQSQAAQNTWGCVLVYSKGPSGWSLTQVWTPPSGPAAPGLIRVGLSMATDGQKVLVGAIPQYTSSACAYVLRLDTATGQWVWDGTIPLVSFGWDERTATALAIDGDWLAIGSPNDNCNSPGNLSVGKVRMWHYASGAWTLAQTLEASDSWAALYNPFFACFASDNFGYSIDFEAGRLIVGAPHMPYYQPIQMPDLIPGAGYCFEYLGGQWVETARLRCNREYSTDAELMGYSVAVGGSTAIVGSYGGNVGTINDVGRVDVFYLPMGSEVCAGQPNSAGNGAKLEVTGFDEASWGFLRLTALGMPPGSLRCSSPERPHRRPR
ncbi:MAG: hypothetical protein R3F17_04300 [Planctomycetota bacterium]